MSSENFIPACDDAVDMFMKGDFHRFDDATKRLKVLKIGTVRSLMNKEISELMETEGDKFNKAFNDADDEDEKDEFAPQIVSESGIQAHNLKAGESAKDYLAGMSKSLEKDMHKEVLLEQRNLLMRIRMDDPESSKYEIQHSGFDMELVEKKMKQK